MFDKLRHILKRNDLAARGEKQLLHVRAAYAESASGDACYDLEPGLSGRLALHAERGEMLNAGHLVARRAVVLGQLGVDDDLGICQTVRRPSSCFTLEARDAGRITYCHLGNVAIEGREQPEHYEPKTRGRPPAHLGTGPAHSSPDLRGLRGTLPRKAGATQAREGSGAPPPRSSTTAAAGGLHLRES